MLGKTSSSSLYVASNNVPYFPVRLPFPKNAPMTTRSRLSPRSF